MAQLQQKPLEQTMKFVSTRMKKVFSGGELRVRLKNVAMPIFLETLLVMMLGATDTFMLSRYSDNSVAAVGFVNQIVNLAFLVFQVVALGTSVLCAQYLGAKEGKKEVQVVGISIALSTVIGLLVSVALYSGGHAILSIMGLRPDLMADGLPYMKIVGAFAFLQAISMTLSASLRAADKAYYPMVVTLVVNVINLFGNYILIFGAFGMPRLGAEGAAISTSFSRGVAVVLLFLFLKKKHIPRFPLQWFLPFPKKELGNLLKIGLPSAGEQISYSLSQVVITYFINMLGNEALTARAYCMNLVMFSYLLSLAIGQGGAIVIGHLVGERHSNAAFVFGKYGIKLSIFCTFVISILLALSGEFIFPFLTHNKEIIAMGIVILWIDVLLENGRAINIFFVNSLRSAGDIYFCTIVGLIVMWSVSVGLSYYFGLSLGWGLAGMWFAFLLDENIRGLIFIKRWWGKKWMSKAFV